MAFEVGQGVRVLPGARSVTDDPLDNWFPHFGGDKTGVIIYVPDLDGDYTVEDDDGEYWAFAPKFLEALEETPDPTPEVKVGDKVRVTREFVVGRNDGWRLIVDDLDRTPIVVEGAKVEILERAHVAPKVGDTLVEGQTYPKGTAIVLDTDPVEVLTSDGKGVWRGIAFADGSLGSQLEESRWRIIYIPEEGK